MTVLLPTHRLITVYSKVENFLPYFQTRAPTKSQLLITTVKKVLLITVNNLLLTALRHAGL